MIIAFLSLVDTRDLQRQLQNLYTSLKGLKVGMLTNPSAVDADYALLSDLVFANQKVYGYQLVCFFAPEHGLRGDRQAGQKFDDYIDGTTGKPVYSLYGSRRQPSPEQLSTVDVVLYDIADVGVRFYTFIWSLTYVIQAARDSNKKVIVFDRPNPNINHIQGCPLQLNAGLIGRLLPGQTQSVPIAYGLTVGQLIIYLSPFLRLKDLTVIEMVDFYRNDAPEYFVPPSPNIPTAESAILYVGSGLFEQTSVSEGRGSTKPFQYTGVSTQILSDPSKIVERMNSFNLTGVKFRPVFFQPTFSKYVNQTVAGVHTILDKQDALVLPAALLLIQEYIRTASASVNSGMDLMFGVQKASSEIRAGRGLDLLESCAQKLQNYRRIRDSILIYTSKDKQVNK